MRETKARYPNQKLDDMTSEAYMRDWREILEHTDKQRFESALKFARMKCKFFPVPADIWEYMPTATRKPRMAYDENCKTCRGLGWKNVGPAHPTNENPRPKEDRYERCDCAHVEFQEV